MRWTCFTRFLARESVINSLMTGAVIIQRPVANQWTGFYMITASVMKELSLTLDIEHNQSNIRVKLEMATLLHSWWLFETNYNVCLNFHFSMPNCIFSIESVNILNMFTSNNLTMFHNCNQYLNFQEWGLQF